jgi:CO/xanthine dehydrogenase FAD-binding subunit
MSLPRFDVLVPRTIEEACEMLTEHADAGARILAGGTDILVDLQSPIIPQHVPRCDGCSTHPDGAVRSTIDCKLWDSDPMMAPDGSLRRALQKEKLASPAYLISLHKLDELKGIQKLPDGSLQIGAMTTVSEIACSAEVRAGWTALVEGAECLGSPLVRNLATLGGNIANARPAADTAVPTITLNGTLVLQGTSGIRRIPAKDFPRGPGISVIKPYEILISVLYPPSPRHSASTYYKLANRKALEISTVGVAIWLSLEEPGGPIADVRIALGAVGPTPILAESARDVLIGRIPGKATLSKAARAVADDARPIDDHRGSAWYRLQMVEILTNRLLKTALQRAGGDR